MDIKNIPIQAASQVGLPSGESCFIFADSEDNNAIKIKRPDGTLLVISSAKQYVGVVSQAFTSAPTLTGLVNTIGEMTPSRQAAGVFYLEKTGAFAGTVIALTQNNQNGTNRKYDFGKFDSDKLFLRQYDENDAGIDGLFSQTIIVYVFD